MIQKTHLRKAVFGWKNKSTIFLRKSFFLIAIDYSKTCFNAIQCLQTLAKEPKRDVLLKNNKHCILKMNFKVAKIILFRYFCSQNLGNHKYFEHCFSGIVQIHFFVAKLSTCGLISIIYHCNEAQLDWFVSLLAMSLNIANLSSNGRSQKSVQSSKLMSKLVRSLYRVQKISFY